MNEIHTEDQELRELLGESLSQREPSEELLRNLRVMAHGVKPRRPWWTSRLTLACTLAAGAAVVALTMLPTQATAKTFENLMVAAGQVHRFHFTIDSNESGKKSLLTLAGVDGRFSMWADGGQMLQFDSGSLRIYDPHQKIVTRFKLGGLVDVKSLAKGMDEEISKGLGQADLKKILKDYQAKYGRQGIHISPVHRENGREVYDVALEARGEKDRVRMKVDAGSDLPSQILVDSRAGGNWKQITAIRMRFGNDVDPKLLRNSFPSGAKEVEIDLARLIDNATEAANAVAPLVKKFDPSWNSKVEGLRRLDSGGKR